MIYNDKNESFRQQENLFFKKKPKTNKNYKANKTQTELQHGEIVPRTSIIWIKD